MLHTLSTLIFFQLLAEVLEVGAGVVTKAPRVLGVPRERLPMAPLTTPSDTTSSLPHPQPRLRDTSGLLKIFVQCKNRMRSFLPLYGVLSFISFSKRFNFYLITTMYWFMIIE